MEKSKNEKLPKNEIVDQEKFETINVGEIVQRIKNDHKFQEKVFGKILSEKEFENLFPSGGVTAKTIETIIRGLGGRLVTLKEIQENKGGIWGEKTGKQENKSEDNSNIRNRMVLPKDKK